jgi:K+-sensing histidine kinase KdpD
MADLDLREIAAGLGLDPDGLVDDELTATLLRELVERNELLRKLTKIQRSISHRASLQDVLDAITAGAAELLGDEVVGLRLIDPDDPAWMIQRSVIGVAPEMADALVRTPVGEGAGGLAVKEDRLVIVEDYTNYQKPVQAFADEGLQAAMAAPVHEYGELAGSLVVATYRKGRTYSKTEQDALLAFADHASLALTDARTVERLRQAQHSKDMFFAMASHELKTPLTVIMGTLRTIEKHHAELSGHLRAEMLSSAYERGRELKDLIDRLLQGARAELAGMSKEVDLPELIDRCVRGFDGDRVEVDKVDDVTVETDDLAVYEVVGVFLENATKHSPPSSPIRVAASVEEGFAHISVANEGSLPEGLDPSELFKPFLRGPNVETPGVGLGLYIAARLAEALSGSLSADSDAGIVSFALHFPADDSVTAALPAKD